MGLDALLLGEVEFLLTPYDIWVVEKWCGDSFDADDGPKHSFDHEWSKNEI